MIRCRARHLLLVPCSLLIILMAHKARSQSSPAKGTGSPAAGIGSPAKGTGRSAATRKSEAPPKTAAKNLPPAAKAWVDTALRKMSVDEKIGQLLFTTYHGSFTSTDSPAYQQLLHDVQDLHVGGFIVITHGSPLGIVKSQAYPSAVLANQLQAKSKLPLLIGADFERGTAMRYD